MNFAEAMSQVTHQTDRFSYWMEINFTSFNPFLVLWALVMMEWHVHRLGHAVERVAEIMGVELSGD